LICLRRAALSYSKIATGECKAKQKTTFFDLPLPSRNILFKDNNRRKQQYLQKPNTACKAEHCVTADHTPRQPVNPPDYKTRLITLQNTVN